MMTILHLMDSYNAQTQTFVNFYIDKSREEFDVNVAAITVPRDTKEKVFRLPKRKYVRRSFFGLFRFVYEKLSKYSVYEYALIKRIKRIRPDIIHCHFGDLGAEFSMLKAKAGIATPTVVSFYGYDAYGLPKKDLEFKRKLERLLRSDCKIFVEGPAFRKHMLQLGASSKSVFVNPLIISTNFYPSGKGDHKCGLQFLFIGRFVEKKGFHQFIEAVGQLRSENKLEDFTVTVVGSGPMEKEYHSRIASYELDAKFNFLGVKSHEEVKDLLATHDFFVHPSLTAANGDSEGGAPTVLIEAQQVGIPIITSNHKDIPFVMGYNEFISIENDVQDLKMTIMEAVTYKEWPQLISKGREKVREQHSIEHNSTYLHFLQSISSAESE